MVATPVLKAAIQLTKKKSHGNNVCDVIIAYVISTDAHTHTYIYIYRRGNHKVILEPAGRTLHVWPASNNWRLVWGLRVD